MIQLRRKLPGSTSAGVKEQLHYYLPESGDKQNLSSLGQRIYQTIKSKIPGKEQSWGVQQQVLLENLSPTCE